MKKILIFTYSSNQGGSELNAYKILKLSTHANFDWIVLNSSKSKLTSKIKSCENLDSYISINFLGFKSLSIFSSLKKLLSIINSNNYQTVYAVGFIPSIFVAIFRIFFSFRFISTRRERMPWARYYHTPFIHFVNFMSDYIETNSKSIQSELNDSYFGRGKTYFLPNIIFKNKETYLKVYKENYKYIGNVANVRDVKNIDLFLNIAHRMIRKRDDVLFILSGKDSTENKVKNFILSNNLQGRLIILEDIEYSEIFSFYSSLDIFLFTSRFEGSPNVLFEAMSESIPIVASNIFATKEVINDGVNGFLCDIDNENEFIDKLDLLLDNEYIYETIRANVKNLFDKFNSTNFAMNQIDKKIIWNYDKNK